MKLAFVIGLYANVAMACSELEFIMWAVNHGVSFDTVESFEFAKSLFKKTDEKIKEHNSYTNQQYYLKHNLLSIYTNQDYLKVLGYLPLKEDGISHTHQQLLEVNDNFEAINWSEKGYVSDVKD